MCIDSHHYMFTNMVFRLALRYQLRYHGAKLTPEEAQVIENKQGHLQSSLTSFNTKQTHLSFISMALTIQRYHL